MTTTTEHTAQVAFDLEASLEGLDGGSLAWMANEMARRPRRHAWASRNDAIAAILSCQEALKDDDPLKELPWRFAHTPSIADTLRGRPQPTDA